MKIAHKKRGIIIGRFNPPHCGHEHLVEVALSHVHELYIFLCSLERDEISGLQRLEWMKALFPTAQIIHITEENPEAARGQPNAHAIWAKTVRMHLRGNPPNYVFASENYGWDFAKKLGAEFIPVDIQRQQIPVSSSEIRENPLKYGQYLPKIVLSWFEEKEFERIRQK